MSWYCCFHHITVQYCTTYSNIKDPLLAFSKTFLLLLFNSCFDFVLISLKTNADT